MDDIDAIIESYKQTCRKGEHSALATLVHVAGAAFRKVGARMLVDSSGASTGAITAGCIEDDIIEKARAVIRTGEPVIARYDTGSEKEILFGWGSGCDGILSVLIEPIKPDDPTGILPYLAESRASRKAADLATIYEVKDIVGEYSLGRHFYDSIPAELTAARDNGYCSIFIEHIAPPSRLVIFGAGPVAAPLARMASETGWDVTVIDRRPLAGESANFPQSATLLSLPYESLSEKIELDSATAVVITTHNFLDDAALIISALKTPVRTISILSSRGRAAHLIETVESEIGPITSSDRERIYAPAGLDLGGDTPASIALSIIAQLSQIFHSTTGRPLRDNVS
jgi:xanthine/CO dehydrogenase XdhC/CoxF family maturation factor